MACASPGSVPHALLSLTLQASKAQQHQEAAAALSSGDLEQIRIAALQKVKEEAAEVRSTPCCTGGPCVVCQPHRKPIWQPKCIIPGPSDAPSQPSAWAARPTCGSHPCQ